MDIFIELEKRLKSFDWTYPFSDDNRCWLSGKAKESEIEDIIKKCIILDREKTVLIYDACKSEYGVSFDKLFKG